MGENKEKGLFSKFISYYKPYTWWFVLDMTMATLSSVLSIISPVIVRKVLSLIGVEGALKNIIFLLTLVFACYALSSICS